MPSTESLPVSELSDSVRVTDLDFQRHMGNTAFTDLLANARYTFLTDHVRPAVGFDDVILALVHLDVNFTGQVHHAATVKTTTQVLAVGSTSLKLSQRMESDGRVVATSTSVLVLTDRASGKPTPWPDGIRRWADLIQPRAETDSHHAERSPDDKGK